MAAVRLPVYCPIFLVIIAFWVGEHLQTHTQGAAEAILKNCSSRSSLCKKISRVYPSIMSIVLVLVLNSSRSNCASLQLSMSLIKKNSYLRSLNPALIAIHVAVSTLSPVSIHTWIPAFLMAWIEIATSFCSLSSTPVIPNSSISSSSSLITSCTSYSLLFRSAFAAMYFLFHWSKNSWEISFWEITKALSPSSARFSQHSSTVALWDGLTLYFITTSAPLR